METEINNPKVSVLMPAYNAEKYIGEAIESILNQAFNDFEFIIIDDCSTDKTWEIIQEYAQKDSRIKAFHNEKNLGIAGNRNKLKKIAQGEYVIWQDADDVSVNTRIKRQVAYMDNNSEVGMCGGFLQFFNSKGNLHIRRYKENDEDLRKNIFRFSPVAQPGAIIRKSVLDEIGDYDLNYPPAEDLDMSFRIGRKYKFANLQEVVIKYRENNNSATFTKLKTIELKTISIRLRYADDKFYIMTFGDHIYSIAQYISIFIIPAKFKIFLFGCLRNNKKI
ncbi:MAG: glycosyltransferase family 2 protein [Candidatus Falkowbacteria bacterium]